MYEFHYDGYTPEQCANYLRRIGAEADYTGEPTLDNLDMLISCHQKTVPFENLALVMNWGSIDLDPQALYQKIVLDHRGGFCFELNGAFQLLLKGLGYDAVGCMARVGLPFLGELTSLDHRGIIVRLNGKSYYCDVGMGGPKADWAVEFDCQPTAGEITALESDGRQTAGETTAALAESQPDPAKQETVSGDNDQYPDAKINIHRQTRHGQTYWVEDTDEGWKMLKNEGSESDGSVIIFAPVPMLPMDFEGNCRYLVDRGNTIFHTERIVNLCLEDGYIDVRNQILKIAAGGRMTRREFEEKDFSEILKKYFGIIR